ncbi:MAG: hypothetical protein LPH21_13530 [Shewanella sp.]|nr:hypothetical protein [Shewanella sp.]MCF1431733.1 hypothetical protein [Shewanella sp.]MCF1458534.1 hypothetical protein [Shewanella sp.]
MLLIVGVNYLGSQKVGQLGSVLVVLKLLILLLLVVAAVKAMVEMRYSDSCRTSEPDALCPRFACQSTALMNGIEQDANSCCIIKPLGPVDR